VLERNVRILVVGVISICAVDAGVAFGEDDTDIL